MGGWWFCFNSFCSFPSEYQLVVDAKIIVEATASATDDRTNEEALFPERHEITLPLNNLNFLFSDIKTSFNFLNKVESDRNVFLDFDGVGFMSSLDQNFTPDNRDVLKRRQTGKASPHPHPPPHLRPPDIFFWQVIRVSSVPIIKRVWKVL